MTQYLNKRFSVHVGGKDYSDGWERIFGKSRPSKDPCYRCQQDVDIAEGREIKTILVPHTCGKEPYE